MSILSDSDRLRALHRLEELRSRVRGTRHRLATLTHWMPGEGLSGLSVKILDMMDRLEMRFDRKLIVTLIGPSGSGKSTLVNALSGVDDLVPVGIDRPTTHVPTAVCADASDAAQLEAALGRRRLEIRRAPQVPALRRIVLIDTPDTDSGEQAVHIPLLEQAVALSDVLLCVFDAENPKRRDHADVLTAFVHHFAGDSIIGVLNKCDRQAEDDLRRVIVPDFRSYIEAAWQRPVAHLFCVSARRHLNAPQWAPSAAPRHRFDQYDDLQRLLADQFGRPDAIGERRLDNARQLQRFFAGAVDEAVQQDAPQVHAAARRMREAETALLDGAVDALRNGDSHRPSNMTAAMYAKLAQRWLGPVGWLIAAWARWLILAAGVQRMFRYGRPVRRLSGLARAVTTLATEAPDSDNPTSAPVSAVCHRMMLRYWPDIAESLVSARFDPSVRRAPVLEAVGSTLDEAVSAAWQDALDAEIDAVSQRLSSLLLQLFLSLPIFGIIGHMAWMTIDNYLNGSYLPIHFFVHAVMTLGLALVTAFILFQLLVRLVAGPDRIRTRAARRCRDQIADHRPLSSGPLADEIATLLDLASDPRIDR